MSRPDASNIHATALVIGDRGVLVSGRSGCGKSTLALALLARCRAEGRFARLVSDDRVEVKVVNGRLVARAPARIAGLCEVHGLGPRPVPHEPRAVVDLMVRLVPEGEAPRFREDIAEAVLGCPLPLLTLAERNARAAVAAVMACVESSPPMVSTGADGIELAREPNDLDLSTRDASTR